MSWGYLHDLGKPPYGLLCEAPTSHLTCHWDDGFKQWGQQLTYTRWFQTVVPNHPPKKNEGNFNGCGRYVWDDGLIGSVYSGEITHISSIYLTCCSRLARSPGDCWCVSMDMAGKSVNQMAIYGTVIERKGAWAGMGRLSSEPWQWLPEEKYPLLN